MTKNPKGAFSFCKSAKEFAAKEKLEIVKNRGEPEFYEGEPHNSGRRIFAACGGKKCSNYFQNRAQYWKVDGKKL